MRQIDKETVRNKIVDMMGDLKEIVTVYMNDYNSTAAIEENTIMSREYKDSQILLIHDKTAVTARGKFDKLQEHFEELAEVLQENDNKYDFSDPEFASCIALMNASSKPLPAETILGIVEKFLGNRQALLALAEIAKGSNESTIRERVFNAETEIEALQDRLITLEIGFPENIATLPSFKGDVLKIAKAYGIELTEQEKDMGMNYQDIVTMQVRAAMGL